MILTWLCSFKFQVVFEIYRPSERKKGELCLPQAINRFNGILKSHYLPVATVTMATADKLIPFTFYKKKCIIASRNVRGLKLMK